MLALVTEDLRFYYNAARELKERGVPFTSLSPGERIPSHGTVAKSSEI